MKFNSQQLYFCYSSGYAIPQFSLSLMSCPLSYRAKINCLSHYYLVFFICVMHAAFARLQCWRECSRRRR